ncbi:MAG: SUMF1/EgtB/PvdO family nonheme iron enzyme [Planctomycetota bacterium]
MMRASLGLVLACANAGESAADESHIRALVEALDSPLHERRTEAREELLLLGEPARAILEPLRGQGSFARCAAIDYVLERAFSPPAFVPIPGGRVELGSDDPADGNPRRTVLLERFEIGAREVTRLEYRRFLRASGGPDPLGWLEGVYPFGTDALPVAGITFEQASRCAAFYGGRLPTADEWELAARGTDMRPFPWGDTFVPGRANLPTPAGREGPRPVGSFPGDSSPFGVLDMAGNVREWVADTSTHPPRPASKGGFYAGRKDLAARLSFRAVAVSADAALPDLGFRILRGKR